MNQDNIIAMAREAGFEHIEHYPRDYIARLERFASLVAAAAQEEIQEQCRIIGMSAERELRHRTVMEQAVKDLERAESAMHKARAALRQALGEQK